MGKSSKVVHIFFWLIWTLPPTADACFLMSRDVWLRGVDGDDRAHPNPIVAER
ncbi:MAG: hypothetical protein IPM58_03000 [Nitrospira sp.]|nr:hypothetical protein [Nitrospira sp.]